MHELFFDYLKKNSSVPLSEEEKALILKSFSPFKLRKRQHFVQAGNHCKNLGFIIKGATRQYTVDDSGVEHTAGICIENWWVCDRESFVMSTPSIYHIEAWQDTEMLIMSRSENLELMKVRAFSEMVHRLNDKNNAANQKRITSSISFTAEERYRDFVASYPELIMRFPQHIIASYLGMAQDTLSRIKRQLLQR